MAMKRFMSDFIGTAVGKSKQSQQQPKAYPVSGVGVAFVLLEKKSKEPWPVCHTCSKQHKGEWQKCNQISKTVRANIGKLVKAGVFDNTSGSGSIKPTAARTTGGNKPNKQKRGAANAVVKEEDDG